MANGKITAITFKSEWKGPKGLLYYHDIDIDGETYNIGAQSKLPDFLQVGKEIYYEVTDASKNKIKRVKPPDQQFAPTGGAAKPAYNSKGQAIGNALTNATLLACHGKIELKQLEEVARRILTIADNLAAE